MDGQVIVLQKHGMDCLEVVHKSSVTLMTLELHYFGQMGIPSRQKITNNGEMGLVLPNSEIPIQMEMEYQQHFQVQIFHCLDSQMLI